MYVFNLNQLYLYSICYSGDCLEALYRNPGPDPRVGTKNWNLGPRLYGWSLGGEEVIRQKEEKSRHIYNDCKYIRHGLLP